MTEIALQKCFNHPGREAATRCPQCGRFYCRECATEHTGRMICARCLAESAPGQVGERRFVAALRTAVQLAAGFLVAWIILYSTGWALLQLPSSFHEGTLWRSAPEMFD